MTDTPSTPPHRLAGLPAAAGGQTQPDPYDFSVVLGGPLYQIVRRAHLSGDALELVRRRIVVISLFAWLPLLLLSVLGGRAWGDAVAVPFLRDLEMHVRFLLTLPLLIVAELVVHQRMRPVVRQFLERDLIPPASRARFDAAVAAALRLRNSVAAEVLLLALVYLFDIFFWPRFDRPERLHLVCRARRRRPPAVPGRLVVRLREPSAVPVPAVPLVFPGVRLDPFPLAGLAMRRSVWCPRTRIAWAVSDSSRAPSSAFAPLLMAHGTLVAGAIAARIFFQGATLPEFKMEVAVVVAFLLLLVLGPLLLFTPHLAQARRVGPAGVRHSGPALRARVRRQVAAGPRPGRRGARGERRHPVPG